MPFEPSVVVLRPYGTVLRTKVEGMANGQKGLQKSESVQHVPAI